LATSITAAAAGKAIGLAAASAACVVAAVGSSAGIATMAD